VRLQYNLLSTIFYLPISSIVRYLLAFSERCEREPTNNFEAFGVNAPIYDDPSMIQAISQPCMRREVSGHRKLPFPPITMFAGRRHIWPRFSQLAGG
jgi:hypothetical protein